jgi:outer membrane protein, multidrug efflux system
MYPAFFMPILRWLFCLCVALGLLHGCTLQPPASTTMPKVVKDWANSSTAISITETDTIDANTPSWWQGLNDKALASFIASAESNSPTIAIAISRVAEAQANLDAVAASKSPRVSADLNSKRATPASNQGPVQSTTSTNLSASWELDLFGRIRHNVAAANQRLLARQGDAQSARLSLQTLIADTVTQSRACYLKVANRAEDVRSRKKTAELTALRQFAGQVAPIDTARARTSEADSVNQLIATQAQCNQYVNALVAATGLSSDEILIGLDQKSTKTLIALPKPPKSKLKIPAQVLTSHPSVVTALRNADAAYEEIGSAEASRRPSLSLSALLGSSWLSAGLTDTRSTVWSLGSSFAGVIFDAGAGKANVNAATARHVQTLAQLESTIRSAVQDIENALVSLDSAQQRESVALIGSENAHLLLQGSEASFRSGRMSLFELEDARRSFNAAQTNLIDAQRDRAQAWIALVKSSGNAIAFTRTTS